MKYVFRKDRHGVAELRLAEKASRKGMLTWVDIYQFVKYIYGAEKARRLVRARIWWSSAYLELAELAEPGTMIRNKAERIMFSRTPYDYNDSWLLAHEVGVALERGRRVYDPYCGWRYELGKTKLPVLW